MMNITDFENRVSLLTKREKEIAEQLYAGLNNGETATFFKISKRTVELHRKQIMSKLRCKNAIDFAVCLTIYKLYRALLIDKTIKQAGVMERIVKIMSEITP